MLRITSLVGGDATVLKLEGKLLAPWAQALREQCAAAAGMPVALDLSHVSFVDATGLALLRELRSRGISIVGCSSFVAELLNSEKR